MSELAIRKATRGQVKMLLALVGPSGSGKTYSALRIARGLVGPAGKILVIDTENRRSEIYAAEFDFDILELDPPFSPEHYIEALDVAEEARYDAVVLDSASHEWAGKGGVMELVDKLSQMSGGGRNKYAPWAELTPRHNAFLDRLIRSRTHLLVTLRGKDEYVMEEADNGKKSIKKVGVGPQQRPGIEYEFYVSLLIDQSTHYANVMKDNTHLFEGQIEVLTERHGEALAKWCSIGVDHAAEARPLFQRLEALVAHHAAKMDEKASAEFRKAMLVHNADAAWLTKAIGRIVAKHGDLPKEGEAPVATPVRQEEVAEGEVPAPGPGPMDEHLWDTKRPEDQAELIAEIASLAGRLGAERERVEAGRVAKAKSAEELGTILAELRAASGLPKARSTRERDMEKLAAMGATTGAKAEATQGDLLPAASRD